MQTSIMMALKRGKDRAATYILTNNPMVQSKWQDSVDLDYVDLDLLGFFKELRDRIHAGEILLSHPLSSSIKPGETPYKSVLLDRPKSESNTETDQDSLEMVETAIQATEKFLTFYAKRLPVYSERVHRDFQLIDLSVINSALESAGVSVFEKLV